MSVKQSHPYHSSHLTSSYSLVSLIGILIVAMAMAFFYRAVAVNALMRVQDESNADLTRAFADSIWNKYANFIERASNVPPDQLALQPEITVMRNDIKQRMQGMRVVKIKIYDRNGLTVFSTEVTQIGEPKGNNPGFQGALKGKVISKIVTRDNFNAFDQIIEDRDLLSSYLPVRTEQGGPIVGVFELYTDITTLLAEVRQTEYKIMALVIGLMLGLYLFLLIYVRRADGLIKQHEEEERELQQERIRYLAQHDQLTGLPNRILLLKLLDKAVQRARLTQHSLAVLYLDIDRFKLINDNLGHEAGNQILLGIISRISQVAGEHNLIGRIGGDELVLVHENLTAQAVEKLAARIISKLSEPFKIGDAEVTVTVSTGITLFPDDNHNAEHLLKDAEAAMLRAKEQGRNRYAFFTEELNAHAIERFELEHGLHKALTNHEFELHYQPRINARTGQVLGAEALLRWRRDENSILMPVLFISVLEEMGLIVPVGAWALRAACKQCKAWQIQGYPEFRISVNLSMRQFHAESLLPDIRNALLESGLAASSLELELTETVLADDAISTARILHELKDIGVKLSIDDFGTGYSSLSYLMHFPIDSLKIDRAFVQDAIANQDHANLTRTIVTMAQNLNLNTVAEGVRTEAHRDFLMKLGCDELQGSFYSQPVPPAEFFAYLQNGLPEKASA